MVGSIQSEVPVLLETEGGLEEVGHLFGFAFSLQFSNVENLVLPRGIRSFTMRETRSAAGQRQLRVTPIPA